MRGILSQHLVSNNFCMLPSKVDAKSLGRKRINVLQKAHYQWMRQKQCMGTDNLPESAASTASAGNLPDQFNRFRFLQSFHQNSATVLRRPLQR